MIASDNVATPLYRLSGTNDGEFFGQPATGKRFEVHDCTGLEVVERKVSRVWRDSDTQGLMRQLGLGGCGILPGVKIAIQYCVR